MKKIYVFYGEPKTGKSIFVDNVIYDKNKDKYYDDLFLSNDLFLNNWRDKFSDTSKKYRNLIFADLYETRPHLDKCLYDIMTHSSHFENLILICRDKEFLVPILRTYKEKKDKINLKLGEPEVILSYVKFEKEGE